eukprot:CAMPEP_0116135496 /NCGR_PEP_ID=MMETSP0329-20121206/11219_1 /TAXON_ID=697910 /ORGANISM="Pseudo-nitzschia arenysensis, Strain B593" /LENGTH=568 /DNA_ID=CAMNT_0003630295 /DNA_START=52 /DNA_END=1755 /DNA_ORIENTATION=+
MVFYYKIRGGKCRNAHSHITLTSEDITCYVGRDKHENEYLIRYGWPGDVWFHVEGISSAHVYFRLDCFSSTTSTNNVNPHVRNLLGKIPIDDLPLESVEDMCQIVKHNSIKGCKMASCKIVYTPHSNLKKEENMDSGTVTYHDTKLQRFRRCDKDRKRIKELEATKSADISIDYYDEMKANERRIIEQRRKLKKSGYSSSSNNNNDNNIGIYDPVLNDLRGIKAKANRQGDDLSGIESGLAALEGLVLGSNGGGFTGGAPPPQHSNKNQNDEEEDDMSHLPIWQQEANERLASPTSERVRFFLARGYTVEEISACETTRGPLSATLAKLWAGQESQATTATTSLVADSDLLAQIYESRNEEKEVLEAIYGEDDHVKFGWRNETNSDDQDSDEDEDDEDPSKPFYFDSIIPVPGYEPPPRYEYPPPLLLEIYVDHGVSNYPFLSSSTDDSDNDTVQSPVLAVVGGGLPCQLLKRLTDKLRDAAREKALEAEPGEPQIFDLLQAASELAEQVVEEETCAIAEKAKKRRAQQLKEERERAKEEAEKLGITDTSATKLTFRSEADRRAYAQS